MVAPGTPRRRTRPLADRYQLALPLAWLTEAEFIEALRKRGVRGIRRVRYRPNRSRLISLSLDQHSLNLHECFRGANDRVIDAIATFLRGSPGTMTHRESVRIMRLWSEGQLPEEPHPAVPVPAQRSAGTRAQVAFIHAAYRHFNREWFGNRLPPDVNIRLSSRMTRRFGHVEYRRGRSGERRIVEIALNIDLLLEANERHLVDTLLHEMAHVEAWVVFGHRGHGEPWRRVAQRVCCEVNAASRMRLRRRRKSEEVKRIPDLDAFLEAARTRIRRGRSTRRNRISRPAPAHSRTPGGSKSGAPCIVGSVLL